MNISRFLCVIYAFSFFHLYTTNSESLLLLGDSFDRLFVSESCKHIRLTHGDQVREWEWAKELFFSTFFGGVGSLACTSSYSTDTLFYIRIFGSPEKGPYYDRYKFSQNHMYVDTKIRLRKIFKFYVEKNGGYPDRVIFNTAQWYDCVTYRRTLFAMEKTY